jgi:hypothetical protein
MRQYAVPAIGSLFNIAQSPKPVLAFFKQLFSVKKDRAAFAGGPSRGGTPGKGSDSGGWGSYRVAYFANQTVPRIDEAQFLLTFRFFLTGGRLDRATPNTAKNDVRQGVDDPLDIAI